MGMIVGTITNANGEPLSGCYVTILNTDTGISSVVRTNGEGYYTSANLVPGTYKITPSYYKSAYFLSASQTISLSTNYTVSFILTAAAGSGAVKVRTYVRLGSGTGVGNVAIALTLNGVTNVSGFFTSSAGMCVIYVPSSTPISLDPVLTGYTFAPDPLTLTTGTTAPPDQLITATAVVVPTYAVSGRVTLADGTTGVDSVHVWGTIGRLELGTWTSGGGYFSFPNCEDGSAFSVACELTGYTFAPASRAGTISGADASGQDFVATPVVTARSISGRVQDSSGAPISGVSVTADPGAGNPAQGNNTTTGADGYYTINGLVDGAWIVTPYSGGYQYQPAATAVNLAGSNATGVNFTGYAAPTRILVSGYTRLGDGTPLPYVYVSNGMDQCMSGADGYWELSLAPGPQTLTPSCGGYIFTPSYLYIANLTAPLINQNFVGAPAGIYQITGTLYDTDGVTRMSGMLIIMEGTESRSVWTDQNGLYTFDHLTAGSYTIRPAAGTNWEPLSRSVTVTTLSIPNQDFHATGAGTYLHSISGRVTIDGAALEGVLVNAGNGLSAITDATGNYTIQNCYDITYAVTPSLNGYTFTPVLTNVTLAGANVTGINFAATAAAGSHSISGTIRTETGGVISGVTVSAGGVTSTSDALGQFILPGLPDGDYTLTPVRSGYTFTPSSRAVSVAGADRTGIDFLGAVTVGPTGTGHTISGTITGAGGAALPGVNVVSGTLSASTDAYGTYHLADVPDGLVTLYPLKAGYRFSPVAMDVTMAGADLTGKNFIGATVTPTYPILPYRPRNVESGQMMSVDAEGIWSDLVALLAYMTNISDQQISEFANIGPQKIRSSLSPQTSSLFADLKKFATDIEAIKGDVAASENYSAWNVTLPSEEGVEVAPSGDSGSGGAVAVRNGKIRMMGREIAVTEHRLPETATTYFSPTSAYAIRATYDSGLVLTLIPLTGTAVGPSDKESDEYVVGTVQSASNESTFILQVPAGTPALGAHCVVLDGDQAGNEFYLTHFDAATGTVVLQDALTATLAAGVHLGIWLDDPDLRDTPGTLGGISTPSSMLLAIIWTGAAGAPPLVRKRTNIGGEAGTRIHELPWSARLSFDASQCSQKFTFTGESRPIRSIWGRSILYKENTANTPSMCFMGQLPAEAIMIDGTTAKGVNIRISPKDITLLLSPSHLAILDPAGGTPVPAKSGAFKLYLEYAP